MATVEDNQFYYENYDWWHGGEQWSSRWGGTDVQWFGTLFPRIHLFLPASNILEIGPGYGRLSGFLESYCDRLVLVDLTENCVLACRKRFRRSPNVVCIKNDGAILDSVDDGSVDFVFSFFSLVHADDLTMRAYIFEIANKLRPDGVAFLHHSNAGACLSGIRSDDDALRDYRDITVSWETVETLAEEAGLVCRSQELVNWELEEPLTDCFSVLVRPKSRWVTSKKFLANADFASEIQKLGELAELYGAGGRAA